MRRSRSGMTRRKIDGPAFVKPGEVMLEDITLVCMGEYLTYPGNARLRPGMNMVRLQGRNRPADYFDIHLRYRSQHEM